MASTMAAPNLARYRATISLFSGVCNTTGGLGGGGGAAGFAGAAGAPASAGLAAGVETGDGLLAGASPVGTEGGCGSFGSSAMDPSCCKMQGSAPLSQPTTAELS